MTRLRTVCSNVTVKNDGEHRPYVALEHVEAASGQLRPGVELPVTNREDAVKSVPGDVLFGKLRPYLSKTLLVQDPILCSPEFLVLRPDTDKLDPRFLYWLMLSKPLIEWAVATSEGVKMPRTDWKELGRFIIDPPPVREQQRISQFLDQECGRIDALIDEVRQTTELMNERWNGLLDEAFPVAGDEGIKLKYLLQEKPTYGVLVPEFDDSAKGVPFVRVTDLSASVAHPARRIKREQSATYRRTILLGGEVLLGVVGHMGICRIAPTEWAGSNVARAVAVLRPNTNLPAQLLSFWLRSPQFAAQALRATDADTAQPTLGMRQLSNFTFPAPDASLWEATAQRLNAERRELDEIQAALDKQVELFQERRRALITAAVTGQLEVS